MFSRSKTWLPGGIWRPKNPHSLEHLKYLYTVLCKNQTVTDTNRNLLVETLRAISEILIWGDQNDSSVFDFFLEKNMLSFFIKYLRQKSGRFICVQLLQTLNILFENISNETSVYYLLSNNHINAIIVHKFDFSDEEVMAYYISFLKTLSLKLNKHTIHFFYNEHTNDFALYTEAIKFFNHSESMVRIAVRTITLNVYKVLENASCLDTSIDVVLGQPDSLDDKSMLRYIRDRTAAPYFSNLVWFIGNHIIELDACVRNDADHQSRDRLADLVAEHLDHLHYLNDILCLNIDCLNDVLTDHLLNRLLIPLYVYSLTKRRKHRSVVIVDSRPHVSSVVSLFLLSQVFLILSHAPLVRQLADIIFHGDISVTSEEPHLQQGQWSGVRGFIAPDEPLAMLLERTSQEPRPQIMPRGLEGSTASLYTEVSGQPISDQATAVATTAAAAADDDESSVNITDEEKLQASNKQPPTEQEFTLTNRPYLEAIFNALECTENDYEALFALCLLYAMGHNEGINQELLDSVLMPTDKSQGKSHYNVLLVEKLIKIISLSCQNGSKVRLATLEMSILLLKQLVHKKGITFLQDRHLACIEGAKEESVLLLRNFYKSEEIFLDMFEDECRDMQLRPLNVEYLTMDASILLPPTGTPLTGIDFNKRLPCGEVERARRAIRVFLYLRGISFALQQENDIELPLTKQDECIKNGEVLDLNNSDLIACTVLTRDKIFAGSNQGSGTPTKRRVQIKRERRFLVIDVLQLILVEPDNKRLGWGVVKFVGFLQDVEVSGDKEDSRSLHVTIHKPASSIHARPIPLLAARFVFDDHIRCMAAKQRLTKGRLKARQKKMNQIARLLEMPTHLMDSMYSGAYGGSTSSVFSTGSASQITAIPGRSQPISTSHPGGARPKQRTSSNSSSRSHSKTKPTPISDASRALNDLSPDIEIAQEATSPSAFAFHSLNSHVVETKGHTRTGSNGNVPDASQEIPMEDLSKKSKEKSSLHSDLKKLRQRRDSGPNVEMGRSRKVTPPAGAPAALKKRSSSYSPRRGGVAATTGNKSGSSQNLSNVARRGSGSAGIQDTSLSTPEIVKKRERSASSPVAVSKSTSAKSEIKKSIRGASKQPKTLTPVPTVSLVPDSEKHLPQPSSDSPKLLPPSDAAAVVLKLESSSESESSSAAKPPESTKDNARATPTPSTGGEKAPVGSAAVEQLTKLAQIVHKHYNFGKDDDGNNSTAESSSAPDHREAAQESDDNRI
ncbi:protein CLEC16A-like isoform X2 [Tubulanus polymorphus]|uniref:protein CLEC16A-like isoform X2 n=1 Tax=Tubulanus polymorphus TaxID=672921 RepID=UPI003DA42550